LHDEIGQMLTALRMELGHLGDGNPHLQAANRLAEQLLQGVREIARGLRPAMLDELGLAAALQYHTRRFSSHSNLPVSLQVEGNVDHLPDSHRTCIYRATQEALTNCARHARAKEVRVTLHAGEDRLTLIVQDDGVGLDRRNLHGKGLGLLGIEERVRDLGGKFSVVSQAQHGTLLRVELPLAKELSR
jgi:signal transduction histidine kinase